MSGARQGRRRRILQEEVLSASREIPAYSPSDAAKGQSSEGRRYAFADGSLGGALARRHFPNHWLTPLGVVAGSAIAVAALALLHEYQLSMANDASGQWSAFLDVTRPTSLATWLTSSAMLAVAMLSVMVLSVRRRRVDDYRGNHRLWRAAVLMALVMSVDAATNLHVVAAGALSGVTGIWLLAGGAEWWLVVGGLAIGWVGVRVLLDIKESRLALAMFVGAILSGCVAVFGPMVGIMDNVATSALVAKLSQLSSFLLVASGLVAYMRYLRRDVAAGVATKPQKTKAPELKVARQTVDSPDKDQASQKRQRNSSQGSNVPEVKQSESRWTDGSDGYQEQYNDDASSRKLTKSERKRLRKQKAERRAA